VETIKSLTKYLFSQGTASYNTNRTPVQNDIYQHKFMMSRLSERAVARGRAETIHPEKDRNIKT
jgi:hypothetical protein